MKFGGPLGKRLWSNVNGKFDPVTKPLQRPSFSPGDLVQVQTYEGVLRLGMVGMRKLNNPPSEQQEYVEVSFGAGTYPRFIKPNFIRFHLPQPQFAESRLQEFQDEANQLLQEWFPEMEAALAEYKGGFGKDSLIYEDEFIAKVFKRAPAGIPVTAIYAIHRFLYENTALVLKDAGFSKSTRVYHLRHPDEVALLEKMRKLKNADTDRFNGKLMDVTFKADESQITWNEEDGVFIDILRAFATTAHVNITGNPFEAIVTKAVEGVCAPIPSEVFRILGKFGLLPPTFDPSVHGTGCLQNYRWREPEADYLMNLVEGENRRVFDELVVAIDSATTEEVDDAISVEGDWIHIHIADASALLPFGSAAHDHASALVSTIYLPTGKYPMIPRNPMAKMSLDPANKGNLAVTFSAKIGSDGTILDCKMTPSILKNVIRRTYEEIDESWGSGFDQIARLTKAHFNGRLASGHHPFALPKPEVTVTHPCHEKVEVHFKITDGSSEASSMVSESMLIAGRVAAILAMDRGIPIPFRYHLSPDQLDAGLEKAICTGKASRYESLKFLLTLSSSAVDITPRRHWALGLDAYAKSTSPLRRYLDLLLHAQLLGRGTKHLTVDRLRALIPSIYRHEQYIKQFQRTSTRYWTLRYVQQELPHQSFPTTAIVLECPQSNSGRHKVWIESLGQMFYSTILGKLPSSMYPGLVLEGRVVEVDPLKNVIEFLIE